MQVELLRELLGRNLRPRVDDAALGFEYSPEAAVDDFVFMCMLVGNDFIPGLPHLDVGDGALNLMLRAYSDLLPSLGGHITDKETLHLDRFEKFAAVVARHEPTVFATKARKAESRYRREGQQRAPADEGPLDYKRRYYLQKTGLHPKDREGQRKLVQSYLDGLSWCLAYYHKGCCSWDWCLSRPPDGRRPPSPPFRPSRGRLRAPPLSPGGRLARPRAIAPRPTPTRPRRYYPDFYAPLCSDLKGLPSFEVKLEYGQPFPPLAQLLSVLPPQSASLVPPPYRALMLDPNSPVYDAFPAGFELDQNGKRNEWEAIALLPFIDERRLLAAVGAIDESTELTATERARNVRTYDLYYTAPQGAGVVEAEGAGAGADAGGVASGAAPSAAPSRKVPLSKLRVTELRGELEAAGLSTEGRKEDLVARLREVRGRGPGGGPGGG